jgi:inorganic pyrophosphatase
VKTQGWEGPESARQEIVDGVKRYEARLAAAK